MTAEKCGTYAGYQRHKYYSETPCGPCKDANAEYTQRRRENSAAVRLADANQRDAYHEALRRLRDAHRCEFDALYSDALGRFRQRSSLLDEWDES